MKQTKGPISKVVEENELEEEDDDIDADDNDEDQRPIKTELVSKFIRMWPRAIFYTRLDGQKGLIANSIPELARPGVYVLYRDDVPFYVGKTQKELRSRLRGHANGVTSSRTYFWNYFSA
jgi:hypothetical protein